MACCNFGGRFSSSQRGLRDGHGFGRRKLRLRRSQRRQQRGGEIGCRCRGRTGRCGLLRQHGEANAIGGLRDGQLERLTGLQRHLGLHIDGLTHDGDARLIVGGDFENPRGDDTARLKRDIARHALRGDEGRNRIDGNRHGCTRVWCSNLG
jgi:hypothetical protein